MDVGRKRLASMGKTDRGDIEGATNQFRAVGRTDPGRMREQNEDAFCIDHELGLIAVSDGIGGFEAGEIYSDYIVRSLPERILAARAAANESSDSDPPALLGQIVTEISKKILAGIQAAEMGQGGATVAACLIDGADAALAHMGDSRIYLMRGGVLERLTTDHTISDMLMHLGEIKKKEAEQHPMRHVLTRHVGMEGNAGPDTASLRLRSGDRLLLCTDGLTDMIAEKEIAEVLWREADLEAACETLVREANRAGGRDNITVLIGQFGEPRNLDARGKTKVRVKDAVGESLGTKRETIDPGYTV